MLLEPWEENKICKVVFVFKQKRHDFNNSFFKVEFSLTWESLSSQNLELASSIIKIGSLIQKLIISPNWRLYDESVSEMICR